MGDQNGKEGWIDAAACTSLAGYWTKSMSIEKLSIKEPMSSAYILGETFAKMHLACSWHRIISFFCSVRSSKSEGDSKAQSKLAFDLSLCIKKQ